MKKRNYSAIAQLLYFVVILSPPAYAYFVWHWPISRVVIAFLFLFFICIGVALTLGALLSELAMRRRTKEMIASSREMNLACYPGPIHRELLPEAAWNMPLLEDADLDLRNMLHGKTDTAVVKIFDCYLNIVVNEKKPWSGDHRRRDSVYHLEQTALSIESPHLQLPSFLVTPRPELESDPGMTVRVSLGYVKLLGSAPTYQIVKLNEHDRFAAK